MEPLSDAQRKELDELKEVLRQEMTDGEASKTVKSAKKDLEDLKPNFLAALQHAVDHGTTAQRITVATWGYNKLLEESKADSDPIRRLIENMPAPKEDQNAETAADESTASSGDGAKASEVS
jgi:hypothetical protein